MNDLDLKALRQFLAIASLGSMRKAAEALHMSQPPLTVSMRQLEDMLGFALFLRSSAGVTLTDAGRTFECEARRLLEQAHNAVARGRAVAAGQVGSLTVSFTSTAMMAFLPEVLARFRDLHPGIVLQLREALSTESADAIAAGMVDLGFVVMAPEISRPGIVFEPLFTETFVLALPRDHALRERDSIALAELRHDPFVLVSERGSPIIHRLVIAACLEQGFMPRVVQQAAHMHTLLYLVAGGLGVAVLPAPVACLTPRGVVFKPLRDTPAGFSIAFGVGSSTGKRPPAADAFLAVARSVMPASLPLPAP